MKQPTLKSGQSSPWIRAKEVIAILSDAFDGNLKEGEDRLLTALQAGLIRGQARSASFHFLPEEKKNFNWPVSEWVWRLKDGRFSLSEDRLHALIGENDSHNLGRIAGFKNLRKIDLFEFKIHREELLRHFDITVRAQQIEAASARFTGRAQTDCVNWLRAAFAKDSAQLKRKADFKKEAFADIGDALSSYAFDNAWREVVRDHQQRATAGRPSNR